MVMRMKELIMQSKVSEMTSKILTICLQRNYSDSLEEFTNMSCCVWGKEVVKTL